MTASKKWLANASFCAEAAHLYRTQRYTTEEIAAKLGCSWPTLSKALALTIPPVEYKQLKQAAYSRSKTGHKNPMFGVKTAAERIMRRGYHGVWNGNGYTPEHRLILMKALGLTIWPKSWEVHHIDGDKTNNSLDNLAIVTKRGHRRLHKQKLGRLYLWEKEMFGTSLLKEMKAIAHKD